MYRPSFCAIIRRQYYRQGKSLFRRFSQSRLDASSSFGHCDHSGNDLPNGRLYLSIIGLRFSLTGFRFAITGHYRFAGYDIRRASAVFVSRFFLGFPFFGPSFAALFLFLAFALRHSFGSSGASRLCRLLSGDRILSASGAASRPRVVVGRDWSAVVALDGGDSGSRCRRLQRRICHFFGRRISATTGSTQEGGYDGIEDFALFS